MKPSKIINQMKNLILILPALLYFSCKKDKTTEPAPANNSNSSPAPTSTNVTKPYNALFEVYKQQSQITSGTPFSFDWFYFNAHFSSTLTQNEGIPLSSLQNIGSVYCNNSLLTENLGFTNKYQFSTTTSTVTAPYTWSITGSSALPAGNYTVNINTPNFNTPLTVLDSASKAQGFTVILPGTQSTDFIEVMFQNGFSLGQFINKRVAGNTTSVQFTNQELATIPTGTAAMLRIKLVNDSITSINNNLYNFRSTSVYQKYYFKLNN